MDEPQARFDAAMGAEDRRFVSAYAHAALAFFEQQYEAEPDMATLFTCIPQSVPAQLATDQGL